MDVRSKHDRETPETVNEAIMNINRRRVLSSAAAASLAATVSVPVISRDGGGTSTDDCTSAPTTASTTLLAGQTEEVGTLEVHNSTDQLTVSYTLSDGWELSETRLYVGKTCPEELSSALGQFPFGNSHSSEQGYTYDIGFDEITSYHLAGRGNSNSKRWVAEDNYGLSPGDTVFVAAHAAVKHPQKGEETAWADGAEFGTNWAMYFQSLALESWPESGTISVGFEDLPLEPEEFDTENDFDYNDWVVDIETTFIFVGTDREGSSRISTLEFSFVPQARGAEFEHVFSMMIESDTFGCDGEYSLVRYDTDGDQIAREDGTFDAGTELDVEVLKSAEVFPALANTDEESTECDVNPAQTAELSIEFDDLCPFDFDGIDPASPHGQNLFFDPYLFVVETGEEIHRGASRLLTVPVDWKWSEETTPIWEVFDDVEESSEGEPVFTERVWWDTGNDRVFDGCAD